MRCLCGWLGLLLLAAPLSADERMNVRVLYCGDPGSQREADYRSFLAHHFTKVTLGDTRAFKEKDADGQDVVILDWSSGYDGKGNIDQKKDPSCDPKNPLNLALVTHDKHFSLRLRVVVRCRRKRAA